LPHKNRIELLQSVQQLVRWLNHLESGFNSTQKQGTILFSKTPTVPLTPHIQGTSEIKHKKRAAHH